MGEAGKPMEQRWRVASSLITTAPFLAQGMQKWQGHARLQQQKKKTRRVVTVWLAWSRVAEGLVPGPEHESRADAT